MIDTRDPGVLEAAQRAIGETFEGLAFAQVLESEALSSPPSGLKKDIGAYIDLVSPAEVRFFLVMTPAHLEACFSAAYPDIDRAPREVLIDFAKELTNTSAGHFMSSVCPERQDMHIGLPVEASEKETLQAFRPATERSLMRYRIEEHDLYFSLAPVPE